MNILDYKFTFETQIEHDTARRECISVPEFDIVRMHVAYPDGYNVDYPVKSREELKEELIRLNKAGATLLKIYQDTFWYEPGEYC